MELTRDDITRIRAEVEQAAKAHMTARDANTALSQFTDDIIAVRNMMLFPSFQALAADVRQWKCESKMA